MDYKSSLHILPAIVYKPFHIYKNGCGWHCAICLSLAYAPSVLAKMYISITNLKANLQVPCDGDCTWIVHPMWGNLISQWPALMPMYVWIFSYQSYGQTWVCNSGIQACFKDGLVPDDDNGKRSFSMMYLHIIRSLSSWLNTRYSVMGLSRLVAS